MKGSWTVEGFRHNLNKQDFTPRKLRVMVTRDKIGCTVSIGDEKDGTMFTVPFDVMLKELNKK